MVREPALAKPGLHPELCVPSWGDDPIIHVFHFSQRGALRVPGCTQHVWNDE